MRRVNHKLFAWVCSPLLIVSVALAIRVWREWLPQRRPQLGRHSRRRRPAGGAVQLRWWVLAAFCRYRDASWGTAHRAPFLRTSHRQPRRDSERGRVIALTPAPSPTAWERGAARSPSPASRERGTQGVRAQRRTCPFTPAREKSPLPQRFRAEPMYPYQLCPPLPQAGAGDYGVRKRSFRRR